MKRLLLTLSLGALAVFGLHSCTGKEPIDKVELRPYCELEKFSVSIPNVEAKIDKEKALVELYVAPDQLELLSDVKPTGEISVGATVVPSFDEKQNFTKEVTYTVTAEDGTTKKVWTVKPVVSKYMAQGIGSVKRIWMKKAADIGLTVNEPTIASFEDKVIVSRPGMIIDGKTGDKTSEMLNITGIVANPANPATLAPFVLANDSKGNLLGATLGQFARGISPWKVYKWTALNAAPVEVISHEQSSTELFGRRLTAVGDVNGNAIVTSYNVDPYNINNGGSPAASPAAHYCWKITNGTVNTTPELVAVPAGYRTGDMYQALWPASAQAVKPFYFSDRGSSTADPKTRLGYVGLDDQIVYLKGGVDPSDIMGDKDEMFKEDGFGRKVLHIQPFTFNGVNYLAVCSYYSTEIGTNNATEDKIYVYTQLLEVSGKDYKGVFIGRELFDGKFSVDNFNGTGGLAISVVAEGSGNNEGELSCRVYNLMSGVCLVGYSISNVKE